MKIDAVFLGKVFGRVKSITVEETSLIVEPSLGVKYVINFDDIVDIPKVKIGWFGATLFYSDLAGKKKFSFLEKHSCIDAEQLIKQKIKKNFVEKLDFAYPIFLEKISNQFLRDSSIEIVDTLLLPISLRLKNSYDFFYKALNTIQEKELSEMLEYFPIAENRDEIRNRFEVRKLHEKEQFFDSIESNPLTHAQRLAVIRNNDINLVLAAAGTGKTSVMVAKALELIKSGDAESDEVLVLAYNNAASKELQQRMNSRGMVVGLSEERLPTAATFHALGRNILKATGATTYLSEFSEDPIKLKMWVSKWIVDYITSSPKNLRNFISLSYQPVNPFDFKTKEEYDAYIRDNEYRTLQGERVKGFQELLIANWLFMNSVAYEYEAPFVTKRRIEIGLDYRPDFHFVNTNVYLEHFGIDRKGKTRIDINQHEYRENINNKRLLHQECETVLLETYHYDWVEGQLENRLQQLITDQGITLQPKSENELFECLQKLGFIEESVNRYLKCLQAMRTEWLEKNQVLERLVQNEIFNALLYSELFDELHEDYKTELKNQERIDFDDMILGAIHVVENGHFKPTWKHILVDEFQDISMARMEFLKALISKGPNPILTVVGDDWQSIYRFSGGKLELTTRFDEMVGTHSLTKLEKTFRYNNSIADIAGTFIMRNPEQYTKNVITHTQVSTPQVFLLDSKVGEQNNLEERVIQIIKKIRDNDSEGSVAVLARYNYLVDASRKSVKESGISSNVWFWTFHGSKGLEADYCILIGFFQGKTGFPNENREESVVESLLPSLDSFPHSEERRLFYVALTRARKKSYLIADPMAPSDFINELLSPHYQLNIVSKTFEEKIRQIYKCPVCSTGYLRLKKGKFGDFYSCSSGSICRVNPRICEKCGAPSIDKRSATHCNNTDCSHVVMICDKCGRPMKLRSGKFGEFWGCTGYGIKNDQCRNTKKIQT